MNEQWITNKTKKGITYTLRFHTGRNNNGAYVWKKITAKTKSEARRLREEYELKNGSASKDLIAKQSFYGYLQNWGELYYKNSVKEQTYYGFLDALKSRIKPFSIATMQMNNITTDVLQRHINELTDSDYSVATIIKTWRFIKNCLKHAADNREIAEIKFDNVRLPKEENVSSKAKKVIAFSLTDVDKIIAECKRKNSKGNNVYQYSNEIIFLMNTGLRIGEATALEWRDIDFDKCIVNVYKSSTTKRDLSENAKKKNIEIVSTTKTLKSERKVVLNKTAIEALQRIKEKNGGHCDKTDRVFLSLKFTSPSRRNINRCLSEITKNAETELRTGSVHVLRHTYASMFLSKDVPISFISKQLGHAKESTTRDIYISYLPEKFDEHKEMFKQL